MVETGTSLSPLALLQQHYTIMALEGHTGGNYRQPFQHGTIISTILAQRQQSYWLRGRAPQCLLMPDPLSAETI